MGFRVNTSGKVKQSHFAQVPASVAAPRSAFDRSFSHKTTISEGYIYPLFWEPILPGDTVNLSTNILARLATPLFPYMDNVYMDVHFFFVPNRLLWENWERFQGAQDNPDDTTDYEVPSLDDATHAAGFAQLSIYDYFGLPTQIASIVQANMPIALPLRAYNKIWNEWYRDENLQDSLTLDISDGPDTTAYALALRNRRKDYFTSCLPWPQKGDAVTFPLGTTAPLVMRADPVGRDVWQAYDYNSTAFGNGNLNANGVAGNVNDGTDGLVFDPGNSLYVDLSAATASTVNTIREAFVLQQMLELDARGGTRYVEALLARFGVVSPDFRLQRSEYLGGQTININVNPVAQTSATSGSDAQGSLSAFAVGRGRAGISHSFVEHGQLLGLISIRADATYQQGLSRHWSVRTRYDYYEPMAANLGEQAVLNKEIYFENTTPNEAFGYQERWAEYRFKPSYVTGKFRSNATGSLDTWHLAIDFNALPELEDIIPETPPIERIIAVSTEPHFIVDSWTRFRHVRVLPIYSVPGLTRL